MRTLAVTGAASGIGRAAAEGAAARGWNTITVDIANADIAADLSSSAGRKQAIEGIVRQLAGRPLDGLIACAGIAFGDPAKIVGVNFFGATELIGALRPQLELGNQPRVVAISSNAQLHMPESELPLVEKCLAGDESGAGQWVADKPDVAYYGSKRALSLWIKREAVLPQWTKPGVLLNAVAPGATDTPMIRELLATAEGREYLNQATPMRLGRAAQPQELAELICFLASPENSFMVGQTVYCDGGGEATLRPHSA